jgi:hypothetical protein
MQDTKAWEAFYKSGRIDDYMTYRQEKSRRQQPSASVARGEDMKHAADPQRSYSEATPPG